MSACLNYKINKALKLSAQLFKKTKQISFQSILLNESFNMKNHFTLKKTITSKCSIYV